GGRGGGGGGGGRGGGGGGGDKAFAPPPAVPAGTSRRSNARRQAQLGLLPSPIARPACGGRGSASCARWIAARRARMSGAIGAPRRVARLTCSDISSLVAARKPSVAWYMAWM